MTYENKSRMDQMARLPWGIGAALIKLKWRLLHLKTTPSALWAMPNPLHDLSECQYSENSGEMARVVTAKECAEVHALDSAFIHRTQF